MKFDVVIGNPPYQDELVGEKTSAAPIYHKFVEESYKLSDRVCLITPARFLFNAGRTPKKWNMTMLNDGSVKVVFFEQNSSNVFLNTDIKGGIAITYRDTNKHFGKIGVFIANPQMSSVLRKVNQNCTKYLSSIVSSQSAYKFTQRMHNENPNVISILSKGNEFEVGTKVLNSLDGLIFYKSVPNDGDTYVKILGLINLKREYRFIKKDYINTPGSLYKYKVLISKANGTGQFGELLSSPLVADPKTGHTQSFLSIGSFTTKNEAKALLKYIKTKFTRSMLGILKITQDNLKNTWSKVPLQDFTHNSDIDWSKSIKDVDQQLYKKYNLSEEEINFIEANVKEME